jgi:hypothetical protein
LLHKNPSVDWSTIAKYAIKPNLEFDNDAHDNPHCNDNGI